MRSISDSGVDSNKIRPMETTEIQLRKLREYKPAPDAGSGNHDWMWGAVGHLIDNYTDITDEEVTAEVAEAMNRDPDPEDEIASTIANYRNTGGKKPITPRAPKTKFAKDVFDRYADEGAGIDLVPPPPTATAKRMLSRLIFGDDGEDVTPDHRLLCIADTQKKARITTVGALTEADIRGTQFVVPAPMKGLSGTTKSGKTGSPRCADNVKERLFWLLDFDAAEINGQVDRQSAAVLAIFGDRVEMIVETRGKGIHAWIRANGEDVRKVKAFAVAIGADGGVISDTCKLVRMPMGTRIGADGNEVGTQFVRHYAPMVAPPEEAIDFDTLLGDLPRNADESAFNDRGNAERFARLFGGKLCYHHTNRHWMKWAGDRWALDSKAAAERHANAVADDLRMEAFDTYGMPTDDEDEKVTEARDRMLNAAFRLGNVSRRNAMLDAAKSHPVFARSQEDFDVHPWQLNCLNGTVDLRTGVLSPHNPEDMLSNVSGANYDPGATCPKFRQFLDEIFEGDAKLRDFVVGWLGYCLTGEVSEQKLAFFYGTGKNGKSTLVEIFREIAGYYARGAPRGIFAPSGPAGSGDDYNIAALKSARAAFAGETDEGKALPEGLIKTLTGDDKLTARLPYGKPFDFSPTHKLTLSSNHKPRIKGTDHGIWRRILLIPFTYRVPPDRQDKKLKERLLAEERDGIFTMMVDAAVKFYADGGLTVPKSVADATKEYRTQEDTIGQFLTDETVAFHNASVPRPKLFEAYIDWCVAEGIRNTPTRQMFNKTIEERGFVIKKEHGDRCWSGIRLKGDETVLQRDERLVEEARDILGSTSPDDDSDDSDPY